MEEHTPAPTRFKLNHLTLFGLLSVFLLLTIALVVYVSGKPQELRKKAAVSADVNMTLAPGTKTVAPDTTFPLQLVVSSGSHPVTTIQLSLKYDPQAIEITGHTLPTGWNEIIPKIDNVNGKMTIVLGSPILDPPSPPTGNFIAMNLTVHAKPSATGTTAINFTAGENVVLISTDQSDPAKPPYEPNNHIGSTTGSQITIQAPIITPTRTPTPIRTSTPTPTRTPTRTPTPIRTSTPTPTRTPTRTPTPIRTSTPTPTRTPTPALTRTPTPIRTSTPTPTRTPTPALTRTPTPIRTSTPTPTRTPTPALTRTPTPIRTSTPTPTRTPTPTPIRTNTPTPTARPTNTPTPTPTSTLIPGDLTGNGTVDIYDYNIMLEDFGKTGSPGWIVADINKDGKVDIYDYNILIGNFGK